MLTLQPQRLSEFVQLSGRWLSIVISWHTYQTHRAYAPFSRHLHSHDLHNFHYRRGTPRLECASGVFRSVHHNLSDIVVLEFTVWFSVEACKRPVADICLAPFLQLRGDAREHLDGNLVPGLARETPLEHMFYPFLVGLRECCVPPIEQVEFNRIAVALPSVDERMVRLADGVEWVERPGVEVGDETENSSNIVTEDSRGEVATVNQTCHIEYIVVLFEFLLRCKSIPICCVTRVDPGPTFVDLENLFAVN